ncbi:glycosyltransferase [Actinocorallia libanotica]|uniref:Glycosyltransferase n=2 Tax=Actinocorallia libanotica TaxID=46162 RepID=A0ABN1R6V8_9ACTN
MVGIPAVSHVLPSLEVIRALVGRGHRVTYANDPAVAGLVASTGAELVPCASSLPVADHDWPVDPVEAVGVFLDDAMRMLPQLRSFYEEDPADVYLYDIGAYAARALAESQGRPVVQLSPTIVAWEGSDDDLGAEVWALPGMAELRAKFSAWLAECGASTTDMAVFSRHPARTVALVPSVMQPCLDRVDTGSVTFVGLCPGDRGDQGGWERPAGAERVLLVSLGTAYTRRPEFYRRCVAAFGGLSGWHVVLQIGVHTDPAELGEVPSNVEVRSWVPQLAILEEADVFVTHAGMGGSSEGLLTGTPMVAVPQAVDQFMNAERLVELGVARRFDTAEVTADGLRSAVLELAGDPVVACRAAELRAQVRAEGGVGRAVEVIESVLS